MKIVSSQVALAATHQAATTESRQERLLAWVGNRPNTSDASAATADRNPDRAKATVLARAALADGAARSAHGERGARGAAPAAAGAGHDAKNEASARGDVETDRRVLDLVLLVRTFGGSADDARRAAESLRDVRAAATAPARPDLPAQPANQPAAPAAPARAGWGLEYDLHIERRTVEETQFSAAGQVATADGRAIAVAATLDMSSVTVQRADVSVRAGDARKVDPLVLNLDGTAPRFDGRQSFDLNADGAADDIARLSGNSAYLVLDRNGDGVVNDGRELFGPTGGDGFAELAAGDADGNGWIDENDAIFDELRLWRPGSGGDEPGALQTLRAAGVGAIYLGAVTTPFTVRAGSDAVAQIAKTGLFLKESGEAGTVQHVDLLA